ncbi:MAG: L-threonylcarbamoyladenylate synthase [Rhodospirillaceae bacterium]
MTIRPEIQPPSTASITRAAELLGEGELVAFPTETVYGLGADAGNDAAVKALFAAKGRPRFNPLIVHVHDMEAAERVAVFDDRARILGCCLWAGPFTIVLPRHPHSGISPLVCAGLDTIAVRVPASQVARALLKEFGRPIAAPSANRSGGLSPTSPMHVAADLNDRVAMILAGGRCQVGIESTILDASVTPPCLLRPGRVGRREIEGLIGPINVVDEAGADNADNADNAATFAPKSPGQLASHYAPNLPVRLNAVTVAPSEALLAFGPDRLVRGGATRLNLSPDGDLLEAAANLFAMLHSLDNRDYTAIAVMPIPERSIGIAINDRLRRAAAPRAVPFQT